LNTKLDKMTYKVRKQSALVTAVVREKLYIVYTYRACARESCIKERYQHQRALKQEKASIREKPAPVGRRA